MTADPQVGQQYVAAEIIDSNVHMSQTYRFCAEAELTNNRYGQDNSKKKKIRTGSREFEDTQTLRSEIVK